MLLWTQEMWQAVGMGFIAGLILCYLLMRIVKGSVRKQVQTENELKSVKSQLEEQKLQLEKHFEKSAELFQALSQDYQKLYQHLTQSANELLPEKQPIFTHLIKDEHEIVPIQDNPPLDYSAGASGILKAEK